VDPDHRRVSDRGHLADHVLDLHRVDVETRDDDELLEPVDEEQVARGVEEADVAGAPPTVLVRATGAGGPVAAEQVGAADPDLARVVALRLVPELVEQLDLDT